MATPSIKGTQTEKNLVVSYAAESMAYSRYTFYAQQADNEQYFPIGQIFRETAANELHHAKIYFKYLEGGSLDVNVGVDAGTIADTASNLALSAKEEKEEGYEMYRAFAEVADKEGFADIAAHFRAIAEIEMHHHRRFLRYLSQVKEGTVWMREKPITWRCLVCGYTFVGTEPPKVCPACNHPYQHYMAMDEPDE